MNSAKESAAFFVDEIKVAQVEADLGGVQCCQERAPDPVKFGNPKTGKLALKLYGDETCALVHANFQHGLFLTKPRKCRSQAKSCGIVGKTAKY